MNGLVLLLFISSFSNAFGNDCTTIELDRNNGSMSNIPVVDQGNTNTCYAQTGAVLLDAWAHSHGEEDLHTDPMLAALLTNQDLKSDHLKSFSCDAIESVVKHGSCSLEDLNNKTNLTQFLLEIESLYVPIPNSSTEQEIDEKKDAVVKQNSILFMCKIENVIPGFINEHNLNEISKIIDASNKTVYMEKIVKIICRNELEKIHHAPKCVGDRRIWHGGDAKAAEYKNKIHQLLDKPNPQPIAVGYCGPLLINGPEYRGFKSGLLGFTSTDVLKCGLHESAVIGRKRIGEKCFFKIRNSAGKFNWYNPAWQNNYDGNVWVDEDSLTQNMGSLSYLE